MLSNNIPNVKLEFSAEFKRNLAQLAKKYRRIKTDLQELLDELATGQKPGDPIKGTVYQVFKVRVKNTDNAKGKSGGYRIIYQCINDKVILITLYSKSEKQNIQTIEILKIISNYDDYKNNFLNN